MEFYNLAKEIHTERLAKQRKQRQTIEYKARTEYALFSVWCRANELEPNAKNFRRYCREEKVDFYAAKAVAETYLGYEYFYDMNALKWVVTKKNKEVKV